MFLRTPREVLKLLAISNKFAITKASQEKKATICTATKSRWVIEFYYHGGFRSAEPFCLWLVMTGKADNKSLLCYQIGGYSEYGNPLGCKLFHASEMSHLGIARERFSGDRPVYDPENIGM